MMVQVSSLSKYLRASSGTKAKFSLAATETGDREPPPVGSVLVTAVTFITILGEL